MKRILFTLLLLSSLASMSQSIIGNWSGELTLGENTLNIHFNFFEDGEKIVATMDSPDQGAYGINVDTVGVSDSTVFLRIVKLAIQFRGKYYPDGDSIGGEFFQGLYSFPLTLSRTSELSKNRPQDPQPPFNYISQNVTFPSWDSTFALAGTVTYPKGKGPFKAVVLVSGSGPQNRDEEIFNHRPFHVIADQLSSAGYVVFRYDDRGVAGSEGMYKTATTFDFANDAKAAIRLVRNIPFLEITEVGIIGHSEGGIIAAILGAENVQDFSILLAAPTARGKEIILRQNRDLLAQSGMSSAAVDENVKNQEVLFDIIINNPDSARRRRALAGEFRRRFDALPDSEKKNYTSMNQYLDEQIEPLMNPWLHVFLDLEPLEYLSRVSTPVYYILGERDAQVPVDMNVSKAEKIIARHPKSELWIPEGLNHLFQPCEKCTVYEYGDIDITFSDKVIQRMIKWMDNL
jgi:pimeloyl-ACP methyl ester carboxylesterase